LYACSLKFHSTCLFITLRGEVGELFASLCDNDNIIIISNDCANLWRLSTGVSRSVTTDVFIRLADIPGCDIAHKLSSVLSMDSLRP
jgi:hypothetical protein